MRHRSKGKKLGRPFQPRLALLRNLVLSLLQYERLTTTEAKAKEVKRIVDKVIAMAQADSLPARRSVLKFLYNDARTADKLFAVVRKRYDASQKSGFTRIVKLGYRKGDNAPMVLLELV